MRKCALKIDRCVVTGIEVQERGDGIPLLRNAQEVVNRIVEKIAWTAERPLAHAGPVGNESIVTDAGQSSGRQRGVEARYHGDNSRIRRYALEASVRHKATAPGHKDHLAIDGAVSLHLLREFSVSSKDRIAVEVVEHHHSVAFVIGKVAAESQRHVSAVAVAFAGLIELGANLDPLEIVSQDEVHDSANGIRTVNGGCTAGHNFYTLYEGGWNIVDIGSLAGIKKCVTAAVDQHQAALATEPAKVQSCGASRGRIGGRVRRCGPLRHKLRHVIQNFFDIRKTGELYGICRNSVNWD